ncbi:MAG: hypothetical protein AMJ92_04395 [candidate division Zixibacteria bacterium SM23_81]|nr:MAG: hypothetical protein AMJ92_04395 [candidate division Zixibacteria bacterium SM23_81]
MDRMGRMMAVSLLGILTILLLRGIPHATDYVFPDTVGISATRAFDSTLVSEGDTLVVTVSLINSEPDSLRNLYFADHIPQELFDISTVEVWVNGVLLSDTAYIHEVGAGDEVFIGTEPHRWVIEAPPDSLGDRPCSQIINPSTGSLQIVYTARCTTGGRLHFPGYTWSGQLTGTNVVETFGYNDSVLVSSDILSTIDDLGVILSGADIFLFWSPPRDDVGIDHYVVFRDTFPEFDSGGGDSIGVTMDTFYVEEAAGCIGDPGTNCFYLVRAVDITGKESDDSNCAGEFDRYLDNAK